MIQVEIVVAGAMGDLVVSMFPELDADRRLDTWVVVTGQAAAAALLATLGDAGIEVTSVVELPEPGSRGSGPSDGLGGSPDQMLRPLAGGRPIESRSVQFRRAPDRD